MDQPRNWARNSAVWRTKGLAIALVAAVLALSACGDDGDEAAVAANPPVNPPANPPANPPPNPPPNQAPTISGTPPSQVIQNQQYAFTPTASDANGDALTFSIEGRPAWATFTASNGRLSGTPTGAQVGTYSNIRISVSDGTATTNLAPFSITVVGTAPTGSALLTWSPPTHNTDGTPLNNLAGYHVYWGSTPGSYPNSVTIDKVLSSYMVEQLMPGTYHFVLTAFNTAGAESEFSNAVTKQVL